MAILNQVVGTLSQDRINRELATLGSQDLLISPTLGDFSSPRHSTKPTPAIPIGVQAAGQSSTGCRRSGRRCPSTPQFTARHQPITYAPPVIEFVNVNAASPSATRVIEREMQVLVGKPLDTTHVNQMIESVYGSGHYQTIRYQIVNRDEQLGLEITAVDKPWGPNIATFGFQLSNDFSGNSDYQLKADVVFQNVNDAGGELRNRIRLGGVTGLNRSFISRSVWARITSRPDNWATGRKFPAVRGHDRGSGLPRVRARARVGLGTYLSNNLALGAAWFMAMTGYRRISERPIRLPTPMQTPVRRLITRIEYDTLDSAIFPAHGARLDFDSTGTASHSAATATRTPTGSCGTAC